MINLETEFDFHHEGFGSMTVNISTYESGSTNISITVRDGNGTSIGMNADELRTILKALEVHEKSVKEFSK